MGTGDDCGIYDVYINQTLWQSYDGYASTAGEDVIALEVKGDGAHLLEVFQRREKNSASSGYKVRFKSLEALEAYDVETIDYGYDDLSRLLSANYDGGAVEYTYGYDLAGNLVDNNGVTNTFNSANQLTGDGTDTFDYDANGNLWKTNSVVSHTWDRANRLLSHGGLDYAYDGLGNRISQDNGVDVTKYLLDLQAGLPRVLSETVGANVTQFVHSPRGLHATQNNSSNWFWGLQDGLGSQRAEVDVNGAVVASQEFTPYGVVQNVTGSFNSPHAFTGEPVDANGLQYHRARYYDPTMGVWASLDPWEGTQQRPMSLNGYSWVEGNPVMNVDPSGNCIAKEICIDHAPPSWRCNCLSMCTPSATQQELDTYCDATTNSNQTLNATMIYQSVCDVQVKNGGKVLGVVLGATEIVAGRAKILVEGAETLFQGASLTLTGHSASCSLSRCELAWSAIGLVSLAHPVAGLIYTVVDIWTGDTVTDGCHNLFSSLSDVPENFVEAICEYTFSPTCPTRSPMNSITSKVGKECKEILGILICI